MNDFMKIKQVEEVNLKEITSTDYFINEKK